MKFPIKTILVLFAFLSFLGLGSAADPVVEEINIDPSNPEPGDTVEVTIEADSRGEFDLSTAVAKLNGRNRKDDACEDSISCTGASFEYTVNGGINTIQVKVIDSLGDSSDFKNERFEVTESDDGDGTGSVDTVDVSVGSSRVGVPEPGQVEISGEATGSKLQKIQVERWNGVRWKKIKTSKSCSSSPCDISRTYERSRTGTVAFRANAFAEGDEDTSGRETVTFFRKDTDDPGFLDVEVRSTNSPVQEGDTLRVRTEIENTGEETKSGYVKLDIRGSERDSVFVDLGPGESTTKTLEWRTSEGDASRFLINAEVSTEDDSDSTRIKIDEKVEKGKIEAVDISARDNRVSVPGEVTLVGEAGGEKLRRVQIERWTRSGWKSIGQERCSSINSRKCEVTAKYERSIAGEIAFRAKAFAKNVDPETSNRETVTFFKKDEKDPGFLDVKIKSTNSPVTEGNTLKVDVRVKNTGEETKSGNVKLDIRGSERDSVFVDLGPEESTTKTFRWQTSDGDASRFLIDAEVSTEDDSDSTKVKVNERDTRDPGFLDVEVRSTNSPIVEGDTLEVRAEIENTGEKTKSGNVELEVRNRKEDSVFVDLGPGESTTKTLEWRTSEGDASRFLIDAEVSTEDDSDSTRIKIDEREDRETGFELSNVDSTNSRLSKGETAQYQVDIENKMDFLARVTVKWYAVRNGETLIATKTDTIQTGDDTLARRLSWRQLDRKLEQGKRYDLRAKLFFRGEKKKERDSVSSFIFLEREIKDPGFLDVQITSTNSPVEEGERLRVKSRIENTGEERKSGDVELRIDGRVRDSASVSLSPGQTTTERFYWRTSNGDSGSHDARVSSGDDSDLTIVRVDESERRDTKDPDADLVVRPSNVNVGQRVTFDASGSTDNQGIDRYRFDFDGDGDFDHTTSSSVVSESFSREFSATARVKVIDEAGNDDIATDFFRVREDSQPQRDGSLKVTVRDGDGDRLEDAYVKVENSDLKTDRTDSFGETRRFTLEPDFYEIKVECERETKIQSTTISEGEDESLTVRMLMSSSDDICDGRDDQDVSAAFTVSDSTPGVGQSITVDASKSDGDITEYRWRLGDGRTRFGKTLSYSYDDSGTFNVNLKVSSRDDSDTTSKTVTVGETDLSAFFTVSDSSPDVDQRVSFDASGSSGNILEYRWIFPDGTTKFGREVSKRFESSGIQKVTLRVSDGEGNTDEFDRTINVQGDDLSAFFTVSDSSPGTGQSVRFDASGSSGDITEYRWTFPDGSTRFGRSVSESFDSGGQKEIRLRVSGPGGSDTFRRTINVQGDDLSAFFTVSDSSPDVDQSVSFDASGSSGDIIEYRWTFPDGSTSFGRTTSFSFDSSGSKTVRLRVADSAGSQDTFTRNINVREEEPDTGSLTVTVRDDDRDRLENARVEVENGDFRSGSTGRDGRVRFRNLEPDRYDIYVECDGEEEQDSVRVSEGEDEFLTVRFDDDLNDECDSEEIQAELDIDPDRAETGEEIEFDASGSTPRSQIEEYEFDLDDDGDYEIETDDSRIERTFFRPRDTEATVRVTDGDGNSDTDSADYEVIEGSRIAFSNIQTPQNVCSGQSFQVSLEAENTGERDRLTVLEFRFAGSTRSYSTMLDEDESQTVSVSLNSGDPGTKTLRIGTSEGNSDTATRSINIVECDEQRDSDASGISLELTPSRVRVGDSVKVSGYVDGVRGRTNVRLQLQGRNVADLSTQPDGYYQTFIYPEQVGERTVTASGAGKSSSRTLTVLPSVEVINVQAPENIFQGEQFEVCGRVETQTDALVIFLRDGERIKSKYGSGEVCFDTVSNEAGDKNYAVMAVNQGQRNSASTEVNIHESRSEAESFPGQVASIESGDGIVRATVYNTHKEQRRYMLSLEGLPSTWTSTTEKEVILQPGEEREVFFYLTPRDEGKYSPEVKIRSRGEVIYNEKVDLEVGGTNQKKKTFIERIFPFL